MSLEHSCPVTVVSWQYSHLEDYYQLRSDVLYRIKTFKEWLEQQLESGLNKAFDGDCP